MLQRALAANEWLHSCSGLLHLIRMLEAIKTGFSCAEDDAVRHRVRRARHR